MKPESSIDVFVYGTLKPGEANFASYCDGKINSQVLGYTWGDLYALPVGYPAMTEGKNKVWGVLLSFTDPQILENLDRLEGYQAQRAAYLNEYYRALVPVYDVGNSQIGEAWAYYMSSSRIRQHRGLRLNSGSWTGALSSSRAKNN